jgi:hypothetical protein
MASRVITGRTNIKDSVKLLSFSLPPRSLQRIALLAPICIAFNTQQMTNEFDLKREKYKNVVRISDTWPNTVKSYQQSDNKKNTVRKRPEKQLTLY